MQWYAPARGKRGRQQTFSERAIELCLSFKCLFGLALRQTLGLVESVLRLAGLHWRVPDFSTVSRRQRHLQMQLPYHSRTSARELLVDSTGITSSPSATSWASPCWRTRRCTRRMWRRK